MASAKAIEKAIRDAVLSAMADQNVTKHALALRASVARSNLTYWLRDERRLGSSDLCRVLSALGANVTVKMKNAKGGT